MQHVIMFYTTDDPGYLRENNHVNVHIYLACSSAIPTPIKQSASIMKPAYLPMAAMLDRRVAAPSPSTPFYLP